LTDADLSPREVATGLNDILLSALGEGKSNPYAKPREAFEELVIGTESKVGRWRRE
jgi:hypothetical protein